MMKKKPNIAFYWCSSCGGCEESVLDLGEDLLTVSKAAEIVFWPIALDFRYRDIEALDDGEIDFILINGALRMDEQAYLATLLRRKSKIVFAHGTCAHLGGVIGLANFFTAKEILERAYKEVPTLNNPGNVMPQVQSVDYGREMTLSGFHDTVKALDQVIEVDYYVPGCPPPPELMKTVIMSALEGGLPEKGSVLADRRALCDTCPRSESRPDRIKIKEFRRLHESEWELSKCFLDQGLICLGPATRGDCGARCIQANMPCRGCFGPTENVSDQGAKILSSIGSLIESNEEEEIERIVSTIPDPAGLVYRYSLAVSILRGKIPRKTR